MTDVLVAGETLIDFLPDRPGSLEAVDGFHKRPGGAPANVAVGLSRLGHPPAFWTRLSTDPFGSYLAAVLADAAIPDRFVERDPTAKTTLAFVSHDEAGERDFSFYRDGTADTRFDVGRVPDTALENRSWVHAGGVTLASGRSRAATLDLLERAGDSTTVSFDPNVRRELWPSLETMREVVCEALAYVDVCKGTREEFELLGFEGDTDRALAETVCETGVDLVFLTRGAAGALAVGSDGSPWSDVADHPGYAVDVVDTTGAGDAFVTGTIDALSTGQSLQETVAFANAVAAAATTEHGAMASLPDREQVRAIQAGQ